MATKQKLYYVWHVHLIADGVDRKFNSFDCYWHAKNVAAELMNEFHLPLDARVVIRSTPLF